MNWLINENLSYTSERIHNTQYVLNKEECIIISLRWFATKIAYNKNGYLLRDSQNKYNNLIVSAINKAMQRYDLFLE